MAATAGAAITGTGSIRLERATVFCARGRAFSEAEMSQDNDQNGDGIKRGFQPVIGFFIALVVIGLLVVVFPPLGVLALIALATLSGQGQA